jgi:hypothetical protein
MINGIFMNQTTLPVNELTKMLRKIGHDMMRSDDADRFVCNYVSYHSLSQMGQYLSMGLLDCGLGVDVDFGRVTLCPRTCSSLWLTLAYYRDTAPCSAGCFLRTRDARIALREGECDPKTSYKGSLSPFTYSLPDLTRRRL